MDNKSSLLRRAAVYLHNKGQSDLYSEKPYGVVGHILKLDAPDVSDEEISRILENLGIDPKFVPMSAILRDALPHLIQLRKIMGPIVDAKGHFQSQCYDYWLMRLNKLAKEFKTPDEVVKLSFEELENLVSRVI